jgi:hypothetical protein
MDQPTFFSLLKCPPDGNPSKEYPLRMWKDRSSEDITRAIPALLAPNWLRGMRASLADGFLILLFMISYLISMPISITLKHQTPPGGTGVPSGPNLSMLFSSGGRKFSLAMSPARN